MSNIQRHIATLKRMGWTDQRIADELGISHTSVYRWRDGSRHARLAKLIESRLLELIEGEVSVTLPPNRQLVGV